jgi:UDP-3-O-[3-hydroxymyristoyl] glucosamine N-acyltransferase
MSIRPEDRPVRLTVRELAEALGCPFQGDGSVVLTGVAGLDKAGPGELSFLAHPRHRSRFETTRAAAVILSPEIPWERTPTLRAENPRLAFARAAAFFARPVRPEPGIHPTAVVSASARVGTGVSIGALCWVGDRAEIGDRTVLFPLVSVYPDARIGRDALLHSQVTVREGCSIGNNVILHAGVVIGSDGFAYVKAPDGSQVKVPQLGTVRIEDDVEIGANSTVDRAALGETVVGRGTKIDNLVMVAHNVEIGTNAILIAQTGIAGSSKLGNNVVTGGQVGLADHVTVGDNVSIAAQSGVVRDIPAGSVVGGSPHLEIREWIRISALLRRLPDLVQDVQRLKQKNEGPDKDKKD